MKDGVRLGFAGGLPTSSIFRPNSSLCLTVMIRVELGDVVVVVGSVFVGAGVGWVGGWIGVDVVNGANVAGY